jgi:predicted ester cyclase
VSWGRAITIALVAMSGLVGSVGLSAVRAQVATPAADCPATTPEENKALVEGYWNDVYNGRDAQAVTRYLADDFVRNNPSRPQANEPGFDDDIARAADNLQDYPDMKITIDKIVADGDTVSVLLTWSGTQAGSVAPWNAPATEKPVNYWLMAMYRVECGKLAEQWVVADYVTMLRQAGVLTDDELATVGSAADAATPQP